MEWIPAKDKDIFMHSPTRDEIYRYRKNYHEEEQLFKIKDKESELKKEMTKGKREYYVKKLIDNANAMHPPLGKEISVVDVIRFQGASSPIMKHGEFYVYFETNLSLSNLRDIVFIYGNYDDNEGYYTHIFEFLQAMKDFGTLERYGLESNYYYYDSAPIEKAKTTLLGEEVSERGVHSIPKSDLLWMKGRFLKDNADDLYRVVDFVSSRRDKRKASHVLCKKDGNEVENETLVECDIHVVVRLIIDFHENTKPNYGIRDHYRQELIPIVSQTKYEMYELIQFDANYFINDETKETIDEEFTALILKSYVFFFNDQYQMFYDVMFESEEWRLLASSVDDHSSSIGDNDAKRIFLESVRGPLSVKANYVLDKLGLKRGKVHPGQHVQQGRRKIHKKNV